jgi:hypothetical protein
LEKNQRNNFLKHGIRLGFLTSFPCCHRHGRPPAAGDPSSPLPPPSSAASAASPAAAGAGTTRVHNFAAQAPPPPAPSLVAAPSPPAVGAGARAGAGAPPSPAPPGATTAWPDSSRPPTELPSSAPGAAPLLLCATAGVCGPPPATADASPPLLGANAPLVAEGGPLLRKAPVPAPAVGLRSWPPLFQHGQLLRTWAQVPTCCCRRSTAPPCLPSRPPMGMCHLSLPRHRCPPCLLLCRALQPPQPLLRSPPLLRGRPLA